MRPPWRSRWCTGELLLALAIFGGAAALWPLTHEFGQVGRYQVLGPSFWPRIILAGLLGLSAVSIEQALRRAARSAPAAPRPAGHLGRLLVVIGACFGYVAVLPWLGFTVGTFVFAAVFLLILGATRPTPLFWTSLVLTGSLFVLFIEILNAPLPPGRGPFLELTRFLTSVLP